AVTKLHLCTNSRVKCPFPEPISKILSCSFKLIFVIILSTLRFEVIKFCLSFIFFLFIITIFFLAYICFFFFFFIFYCYYVLFLFISLLLSYFKLIIFICLSSFLF